MASYGVHVVWLLVAMIGAAGWGRQVASRKEREFQARLEAIPPARPGASTTARAAVPGGPTADVPPEAHADAAAPRPEKDPAPSAVPLS
ncbi:MAG TPA: hypothetical protein VEJ18_05255, partial [Planctomycetota bacterium]|nr:hypothetical protein [Planctomycetota bacterium]